MKRLAIALALFAVGNSSFAQQTSEDFDEIAPGFRIAVNTLSFYEGECMGYLVRWYEAYPDLNQKRMATYSKADFDWINKQQARNQRITENYVKKNPTQYVPLLKSMPKGDAEFFYGFTTRLKMFEKAPPEYMQFAMATAGSCKQAKFPYFLR